MKTLLKVIKVVSFILLLLCLFLWLVAHGSGHKIPAATDISFLVTSLALVLLLLLTWKK